MHGSFIYSNSSNELIEVLHVISWVKQKKKKRVGRLIVKHLSIIVQAQWD